ncbi:MAG: TetR/AcrR family transcriptional regulator [Pseudomonadota bacterium]
MGRPRKFMEEEVLRCAMMTFWRLGFDATTFRELERLSGVGVRSLSNTFGEKDELFARTMKMYREMMQGMLERMFSEPQLEAIAQLFEMAVRPTEKADDIVNSGCLVVNSVFELPDMPTPVADEVAAYRKMFVDKFRWVLEENNIEEPHEKAEYLLGSLWGVLSQIRLAHDTTAAKPMATVVAQVVRAWKPT